MFEAEEDGREGLLPEGVVDIHAAKSDDSAASRAGAGGEYMRGFVAYLWRADIAGHHVPNGERRKVPQATVTADMRHCLVDWLVDISQEFKLQQSTVFAAVNLLDRALDVIPVRRERLQLLGCACVLIATKLEEVYAPSVDDMVDISANTYEHREFVEYEMVVAQALDFRLAGPTMFHFLLHFLKAGEANAKQEALAWFLAELALMDYALVGTRPSLLAAAVMHLARQTSLPASAPACGGPDAVWTPSLRYYTRYAPSDLEATARLLWAAHARAWGTQYVAVPNKYKRPEKFHTSEYVMVLPEESLRFSDS